MTMDLETRARQAGTAVRSAVAEADLMLAAPATSRAPSFQMGWAVAGAAAAVTVLIAINSLIQPNIVADDAVNFTTTSTVTTTTATSPPTTAAIAPVVPVTEPATTTVPETATTVADTTPPFIEIASPTEGQVFEEKTITFDGVTEPGASVFAGPYQATVLGDGAWSIKLVLSEGNNRTVFTAIDQAGNEASAVVTAVYKPPAPPVTEPEVAAFTANATWLECSSEPPFDEYYGKGQPGSWVVVQSEYGGGETIVKPDGTWYLKVIFDVPLNKVIDVKVKDQYGRSKFFEFVAREPK